MSQIRSRTELILLPIVVCRPSVIVMNEVAELESECLHPNPIVLT